MVTPYVAIGQDDRKVRDFTVTLALLPFEWRARPHLLSGEQVPNDPPLDQQWHRKRSQQEKPEAAVCKPVQGRRADHYRDDPHGGDDQHKPLHPAIRCRA